MTKTEHACSSCQTRKRKCETSGIGKTCVRCKDKNIQCEYSRHKRRGRKPKIESSILTMNETLQTNETNVYPQMENSSTIESQESTVPHSNNLSQKDLEELFPGI